MTPKEMLKAIRTLDDINAELLIEFWLKDSYLKGMQHHITAKHNAEKEVNRQNSKPLPSIAEATVAETNYASNLPAGHPGE